MSFFSASNLLLHRAAPKKPATYTSGDVIRQFAQGTSFSSSDEIEAYMRSVLGKKSYSENLDSIRAELKNFDEENPVASTVAFFTGILPTLAVTAPAAITKMGVMGGSATIGALGGFLEGFLSGEGAYDRTATGASQGILGAFLGPIIAKGVQFTPAVIDFVKNLKNKLTPNKLTPSQEQSKEILNLLKSGKADQVTEEMLEKADQQYLYENYDLPMDTESRLQRAKEMGLNIDLPLAHGTPSRVDFSRFIPSDRGKLGPGVYTSPEVYIANKHAIGGDNRIMPLYGTNNPAPENIRDLAHEARSRVGFGKKGTDAFNEALGDYDGIFVHDQRTFKDPSDLRSIYARFDPRLKHLKNLSAAIPLGVLPFVDDGKTPE